MHSLDNVTARTTHSSYKEPICINGNYLYSGTASLFYIIKIQFIKIGLRASSVIAFHYLIPINEQVLNYHTLTC